MVIDVPGLFYNAGFRRYLHVPRRWLPQPANRYVGRYRGGRYTPKVFLCRQFCQPLGSGDVANVIDMVRLRYYASSFNQRVGMWVVAKLSSMVRTLYNARSSN